MHFKQTVLECLGTEFTARLLHVLCRMLRGEQEEHNPLSEEECSKLQMVVDAYVNNPSAEPTLPISGDMRMIRSACRCLNLS